jgi:hypothetical protein
MGINKTDTVWKFSILERAVRPKTAMPREAAHALMQLDFAPEDRERMHDLAQKASAGDLSYAEQKESETYEIAGLLLDLLRLKARLSLKSKKGV